MTGVLFFSADINYESAFKLKEEQLKETLWLEDSRGQKRLLALKVRRHQSIYQILRDILTPEGLLKKCCCLDLG